MKEKCIDTAEDIFGKCFAGFKMTLDCDVYRDFYPDFCLKMRAT